MSSPESKHINPRTCSEFAEQEPAVDQSYESFVKHAKSRGERNTRAVKKHTKAILALRGITS